MYNEKYMKIVIIIEEYRNIIKSSMLMTEKVMLNYA